MNSADQDDKRLTHTTGWSCATVFFKYFENDQNFMKSPKPSDQNTHYGRTFWYLRLLGPPGLLKNVTALISESWILIKYQLNHPYSVWHPLDTLKYTHTSPYQHRHTQCISKGTHKHPWHSTYILWQPHFAQSPSDHPWPNKSLSDCQGSDWEWWRLFLGDRGNVYRVFDDILGSPGVSWGGQMD